MSVTAKQLSKSGARGKDLDAVSKELLMIIDDQLVKSEKTWGRNVAVCELPINLAVSGLDKKMSQRIVYTTIIKSLQDRGFEVRIMLDPKKTLLFVSWITDLTGPEVDAMTKLIKSVMISPSEVDKYVGAKEEQDPRQAALPPK